MHRSRSARWLAPVLVPLLAAAAAVLPAGPPASAEGIVNLYTSRHYDSDEALYEAFTKKTGIAVKTIEADADVLLARIQREGELSPADVFIAVDAGRLQLAVDRGVLEPVESAALEARIPANLRHPDGLWFGVSKRVRVILRAPGAPAVATYEGLADPSLRGELLIRSSGNVYNQSLVASLIANAGEDQAATWCEGVVENLARTPQGGDRDQARAAAAGEGSVAVANHYYIARMLAGDDAEDRAAAEKLTLVFPDQDGRGAHVNVSGAGVVASAPNRDNALAFIAFLVSDEGQRLYALANFEYPVVPGVGLTGVLEGFGGFKEDTLNASELGSLNREAVKIMDRAGWR
ncbi:Fe(3+) ABC transporter substrate-binding protein [Phycisphaera mikurensis]|uniref:Putative iron ABC transporter substrate binding protein n=1 Tax=Phycisphaera mikurensis (strain NBRC 102666 / KCTC 22515 / FYK2301M01) TaxID=1142394 RepID=I0IH94_PHYMF|nr:Fe(3+) ABC transporter substrate-binding protein [Phycisphaera mikurensis]MBB6440881.1 iron(III) transport system substrate-binding protein [Phycisphaera mikurensis]BAM04632.1 putative iron ABC transporter substrate binding protein [Phycisphaera mikurensis NBRC 102666]